MGWCWTSQPFRLLMNYPIIWLNKSSIKSVQHDQEKPWKYETRFKRRLFPLPQINLRQVVWRHKLTVTQHLNTSCQLPSLLSCFHPSSASGTSSCFYKQDVCTSFSNLPFLAFLFFLCLFFSCHFFSSSQVCRHRIKARICIGFRDCRDSPPPSSPPTSASFLHSCSPLLLCCCYGMTDRETQTQSDGSIVL